MSDDLESELKAIPGIGDAKAAEILALVETHDPDDASDELAANVRAAWEHYEAGQTAHAEKFLRRAYEAL